MSGTVAMLISLLLPPLDNILAQELGDFLSVFDSLDSLGILGVECVLLAEFTADLVLGSGEDGSVA